MSILENLKEINKLQSICPWCNKDNYKEPLTICDNDCGTVYCSCEKEYHIFNNKSLPNHDPNCGEDSDKDSVEDYKYHTGFYNRKKIFRDRFNNNAIVSNMNLSEDIKERIFKNFDLFSDSFKYKYQQKSFLPYDYLIFRILSEFNYEYPYFCLSDKFEEMEELYWSTKDPKNYNNFINYIKTLLNNNDKKYFKIFDIPKKIVIYNTNLKYNHKYTKDAYLLTIDGHIDFVIKYFTKFLPKIDVRSQYQYNLFILEMEELNIEITLENINRYIISHLNNEISHCNNILVIKEEIN
jgi:hypothetical protein